MPEQPQWTIAGYAVHVPGCAEAELPGSPSEPACAAEDAKLVLGRKGMLGKEPATRLALCAVQRALDLPPKRPAEPLPEAGGTAVVVASNLGNVATVCTMTGQVRAESAEEISPIETPNASSNIIASAIAIWYGFTGPNLSVCSGATAALDALRLAGLLLDAGRAERVVLAGVEPADPVATALAALRDPAPAPLRAGAACVLLGNWPGRAEVARCGPVRRGAPVPGIELPEGDFYGAAGVIGLATAAARLAGSAGPLTVHCGYYGDGYASTELSAAGAAG